MNRFILVILTIITSCYSFSQINLVKEFPNFYIVDSEMYGGKMIIAGEGFAISNTGDTLRNLIEWDGIDINEISDFSDTNGYSNIRGIHDLAVYNSQLVVGNHSGVYSYDGTNWETIYEFYYGNFPEDYYVEDMIEYDNKLYISGKFQTDSNNYNLMYWDGNKIYPFSRNHTKKPDVIPDLEVLNNNLLLLEYYDIGLNTIYSYSSQTMTWDSLPSINCRWNFNIIGNNIFTNEGNVWQNNQWNQMDYEILSYDNLYSENGYTLAFIRTDSSNFFGSIDDNSLKTKYISLLGDRIISVEKLNDKLYISRSYLNNKSSKLYVLEGTLGSKNKQLEEKINIYPNPFLNQITIDLNNQHINRGNLKVNIFDILGQQINYHYKKKGNQIIVETNDLKKGIYFINIESVELFFTTKIIKK